MSEKNSLLVCVTMQKDCARLIRLGRELAVRRGAGLTVLHVNNRKSQTQEDREILNELFSLAHEADAEMNILYEEDVPAAIARYARECSAQALILGPDRSGTAGRVRALLPEGMEVIHA